MKARAISDESGGRSFVLVPDPGDEAVSAITKFAIEKALPGASITALGAFERATVGWFDLTAKDYRKIDIAEQCEALSLVWRYCDQRLGRAKSAHSRRP